MKNTTKTNKHGQKIGCSDTVNSGLPTLSASIDTVRNEENSIKNLQPLIPNSEKLNGTNLLNFNILNNYKIDNMINQPKIKENRKSGRARNYYHDITGQYVGKRELNPNTSPISLWCVNTQQTQEIFEEEDNTSVNEENTKSEMINLKEYLNKNTMEFNTNTKKFEFEEDIKCTTHVNFETLKEIKELKSYQEKLHNDLKNVIIGIDMVNRRLDELINYVDDGLVKEIINGVIFELKNSNYTPVSEESLHDMSFDTCSEENQQLENLRNSEISENQTPEFLGPEKVIEILEYFDNNEEIRKQTELLLTRSNISKEENEIIDEPLDSNDVSVSALTDLEEDILINEPLPSEEVRNIVINVPETKPIINAKIVEEKLELLSKIEIDPNEYLTFINATLEKQLAFAKTNSGKVYLFVYESLRSNFKQVNTMGKWVFVNENGDFYSSSAGLEAYFDETLPITLLKSYLKGKIEYVIDDNGLYFNNLIHKPEETPVTKKPKQVKFEKKIKIVKKKNKIPTLEELENENKPMKKVISRSEKPKEKPVDVSKGAIPKERTVEPSNKRPFDPTKPQYISKNRWFMIKDRKLSPLEEERVIKKHLKDMIYLNFNKMIELSKTKKIKFKDSKHYFFPSEILKKDENPDLKTMETKYYQVEKLCEQYKNEE